MLIYHAHKPVLLHKWPLLQVCYFALRQLKVLILSWPIPWQIPMADSVDSARTPLIYDRFLIIPNYENYWNWPELYYQEESDHKITKSALAV